MEVDVLFISRFNAFCGVSTYTEQLATALANRRIDVGALSSSFKPRGGETDIPCSIGWSEDGDLGEALEKIVEVNPKIVHIQHEHGIFKSAGALIKLCREIKRCTNAAIVLTAHTVAKLVPSPRHGFEQLIGEVDAVIVHSSLCKEVVLRYPSLSKTTIIEFIPHGMLEPVVRVPRDVACRELCFDSSERIFRLLSVGFISGSKRHMAMIQIIGAMLSRNMVHPQKLELVIAGRPMDDAKGLLSMMKKYTVSVGIENSIIFDDNFVPFEKLPYYYGASDMAIHMVNPQNFSASGSMRMDLSHGVPIIATRSAMTMDIEKGIYKVGNSDEMMSVITRIVKNRSILEKLRLNALSFAKENSWSKIALRHILLYEVVSGSFLTMDKREGVRSALFHSSPWLLGSPM